jgi:hypothetical protein
MKTMQLPRLFLPWVLCSLAAPALANPLSISGLAPVLAANQNPTLHVTLTEPPLDAVLVLRNSGDQPLHLTLATTPLVRAENGRVCGNANDAACSAAWELAQGNAWTPLPEVADVPAHGSLRVRLSGTVNATGTYRSELTAAFAGGTAAQPGSAASTTQSAVVEVQRDVGTLPADLWVTPAAAWDLEVLPLFSVSASLQADLQNTSGRPLHLRAPIVLSQTRTRGQNEVVAVSLAPMLKPDGCAEASGSLSLPSDQRCNVGVTLPNLAAPGRYAVMLQVSGVGGGSAPVTLQLNVRNPWWCAALPILLGVVGGWVISNWRTSGRDRYLQLANLAELAQEFDRLASRAPDDAMRNLLRRVHRQAIDLRDRLRVGQPTTGIPDYATLRARLDAIETLLDIELVYVRLPAADANAVATQRNAALDAISTDGQTVQAMQQAVSAYHTAVDQAQELARLRQDGLAFLANTAPSLTIAVNAQLPDGIRQAAADAHAARAPLTTALDARDLATAVARFTDARRTFARLLRAVVDWQLALPRPDYVPEPDWDELRVELQHDAPTLAQIDVAEGPALDASAAALAAVSLRHMRGLAAVLRHVIQADQAVAGERVALLQGLAGMPIGQAITDVLPALRVLYNGMRGYEQAAAVAAAAPAPEIPAAPAAAAAPVGPLPDGMFPLVFPATAGRRSIMRVVAGLDWLTFVLGLLLILFGGLQSLWVGRPSWGAPTDWFAAVLWGGVLFVALDGIARPAQRSGG